MRKLTLILMLVAAMALSAVSANAAGRWDAQVTGGVTFLEDVTLDVSTRHDGDVAKGQIQYEDPGRLGMHIAVDCAYEAPDGSYAFSGPANIQYGSFPDHVTVEVSADGTGLRVYATNAGDDECGWSGDYKATVQSGSFNIR